MRASVVIPTWNKLDLVREVLVSLAAQTVAAEVILVDNASEDGTAGVVAAEFPEVRVVRNDRNLGFGRAVNAGAAEATGDVLVVLNNDVVCAPDFLERLCGPFAEPDVGMVAGVLTQMDAPDLVDSAGIELDRALGAWDLWWNRPLAELAASGRRPLGPCGGAAAYRMSAFRAAGGYAPELFAYWEDVDLALRLASAGWRCVLAPDAVGEHRHGATLGASARQRSLNAFGRGYVLGKFGPVGGPVARVAVAALDWPDLLAHVVRLREHTWRERLRGRRAGRRRRAPAPDPALLEVAIAEAARRKLMFRRLQRRNELPGHFAATPPTEPA